MTETISIPFPKQLYDDLVRLSDGRIDPVWLAETQVLSWIERGLWVDDPAKVDDFIYEPFQDRVYELAERYAPHAFAQWQKSGVEEASRSLPLVWKYISIPAGSEVRMLYKGQQHYARVENGAIVDPDGRYSPSEWASKVAEGTSRNAWRDLSFKLPGNSHWESAKLLKQKFLDSILVKVEQS
jgi:hypothetical protein